MEELSTSALDALDRTRTVVLLAVSPLEEHGPHLPVGVDAFAARYLAESVARRLVEARPGWAAVIAPTLHVGSFTFEATGTLPVRQRVVRDLLIDYGEGLARVPSHSSGRSGRSESTSPMFSGTSNSSNDGSSRVSNSSAQDSVRA